MEIDSHRGNIIREGSVQTRERDSEVTESDKGIREGREIVKRLRPSKKAEKQSGEKRK